MGEFFLRKRGGEVFRRFKSDFQVAGGIFACVRTPARPHAGEEKTESLPLPLPPFGERFEVVTSLAKTLQVCRIGEDSHIAPMGSHMVNHSGFCFVSKLGTPPTPRLPQELGRAKFLSPDAQRVQPVPLCTLSALGLGAVLIAIALTGQRITTGVVTWS